MERAIDQLRQLPKTSWSKPNPASNVGNHTYVIRYTDTSNKQLRVFGHFHDEHTCFVMTLTGYEKDNVYYPNNYQDLAQTNRGSCAGNFSSKTVRFRHYCALCQI